MKQNRLQWKMINDVSISLGLDSKSVKSEGGSDIGVGEINNTVSERLSSIEDRLYEALLKVDQLVSENESLRCVNLEFKRELDEIKSKLSNI